MSGILVSVRVTPRGGRDAVMGVRDGTLHLRVAAPPVEGAANRACQELLAGFFGVRRSAVTLKSGDTSREKRFVIEGITEDEANRRLQALPAV